MILQMTRPVQGGLRQERQFELIANHLANVGTTGFKADILAFDQALKATQVVDFQSGDIRTTGNNLDVAISGNGFFKIETAEGIRYTRDGGFTINQDMELVTQNGDPVLGDGAPIVLQGAEAETTDNIQISEDGEIRVDGEVAGQLDIVTFDDLTRLRKDRSSLFVYEGLPADERAADQYVVQQGALEGANIATAVEMTKMIQVHRMYEAFQKMIQTFDEIDSKAVTEVGRL
ncbi:MAG: flagellar hook-basal body protein [Thermodesulfobacteriota bacterium]